MSELDHDERPTLARTRGRAVDRNLLGLLLIGLGTIWFLSEAHLLALSAETVLSGTLMMLGLGLIFTSRISRRRWPILLGMCLTLALIANSASLHFPRGPYGPQKISVQSPDQILPEYGDSFGNLRLDLTAISTRDLVRAIKIRVLAGSATVTLPAATQVQVVGRFRAASLTLCGQKTSDAFSGPAQSYSNFTSAVAYLTLDINASFGNVDIQGCTGPISSAPVSLVPGTAPNPLSPKQPNPQGGLVK